MHHYRGHVVYAIERGHSVEELLPVSAVRAPATKAEIQDVNGPALGVLNNGKCVPLSRFEMAECGRGAL